MANEQNLIPNSERTPEELREQTRKGGIASGKARREKRDLRKAIEILLEKDFKDSNGKDVSGAEAIAIKQFQKALNGDTKAFEVIRDTSGQKPVEKVMVAEVSQEVIDEVEAMVLDDE